MAQKRFFIVSLITIFIIAVLHYLAFKYYWYWNFSWFHLIMHLLGGFWFTLTTFWFLIRLNYVNTIVKHKRRFFVIMIVSVVVVGLSWEIFEILSGFTSIKESGYLNSLMNDLVSNFIGGFVAYFYFIKRKRCETGVICEKIVEK